MLEEDVKNMGSNETAAACVLPLSSLLRRMHGWKPDLWEIYEPCFSKVRGLLNLAEYIDKQNTEESLDDKLISNTLRSTAEIAADGKKLWMEDPNRYIELSFKLLLRRTIDVNLKVAQDWLNNDLY